MPGRHINDHQMRLFLHFRHSDGVATAAAKAGFSTATRYRVADDPQLPWQRDALRVRRRPDPLAEIFYAEVVALLREAPRPALGRGAQGDVRLPP